MSYELQKLFKDINNTYNPINYKIEKINKPNLNTLLSKNKFADININSLKNQYHIKPVNDINIYLQINKINYKLIDKIVNRTMAFKKYSQNKYPLTIYIWLSNEKKLLPQKGTILGPKHINSGSSYVLNLNDRKNGNIYIWRQEEAEKVIIHELLHSLHYDYYAIDDRLDNMIRKKYNVNREINVNESYTEALATILNAMYYSIENNRDYHYFLALLNNEQNHSLQQVHKILEYQEYQNYHQLERKYSNREFKQNTSVFSYYILKTLALNNIFMFIRFAMKNNLKYGKNQHYKYYKILDIKALDKLDKNLKNNNRCLNMTITKI